MAVFLLGVLAQRWHLPPVPQLEQVYALLSQGGKSDVQEHLQPTRGQGDGVTRNSVGDDGALVMLAGFFDGENQVRLVRRDGSVVRSWSLDYFAHFPDAETRVCDLLSPLRVDTHGALVTPAGEVVFNYEYCGTVKLDQCGAVLWTIDEPTHHSLIASEAGGYWMLGRWLWPASSAPERFPHFAKPGRSEMVEEDTVMRVAADGRMLDEFSIPQVMVENGLEALLSTSGEDFPVTRPNNAELVHSNKVAELPASRADAFSLFEAGVRALSIRELNLVLVLDPETREIKWHQVGPWLRQHDPEFRPDGRISIFNNNVYRTAYRGNQTILSTPFATNIILVDPETGETEIAFGERSGEEMLSVVRGQHELLADGGILITEFDAGRVLQVSPGREIVWEYVNRHDDDFVGEIRNAALYGADYFEADWQDCPD